MRYCLSVFIARTKRTARAYDRAYTPAPRKFVFYGTRTKIGRRVRINTPFPNATGHAMSFESDGRGETMYRPNSEGGRSAPAVRETTRTRGENTGWKKKILKKKFNSFSVIGDVSFSTAANVAGSGRFGRARRRIRTAATARRNAVTTPDGINWTAPDSTGSTATSRPRSTPADPNCRRGPRPVVRLKKEKEKKKTVAISPVERVTASGGRGGGESYTLVSDKKQIFSSEHYTFLM